MAGEERFDEPEYARLVRECLPALLSVRQRNATFQGARAAGTAIDEVVIHDTDSTTTRYEDTVNYLAKPGDGRMVSIHYIIGRETGQILAMVPEEKRANHATTHNDRSIGIELWRNTKQQGYTAWQYTAVGQLVYDIMRRYRIPYKNVIGHGFFEASRHGEPRGFEWSRFDDELTQANDRVKAFNPKLAAF